MKCKRIIITLLIITILFTLTGCDKDEANNISETFETNTTSVKEYEPEYGGQLVLPLTVLKTLNPLISENLSYYYFSKLIFEGLFELDQNFDIKNQLAEDYIIRDDGTISIKLKENVLWHDGEKLTAEDVAFTINTIKYANNDSTYKKMWDAAMGNYYSSNINRIIDVYVIDDYNLDIKFDINFSNSLETLIFPIIPKHRFVVDREDKNSYIKALMEDDYTPIGTGPYRFSNYDKYKSVQLEYFQDYREGRPYIDKIIGKILEDDELALTAFEAGQIDLTIALGVDWEKFDQNNRVRILEFVSQNYDFLGFNFSKSIFNNEQGHKLRKAMAYGIDRQAIIQKVFLGHATQTDLPIHPNSWLISDEANAYGYNLSKAREEINELGWKDINGDGFYEDENGKEITLRLITNSYNPLRLKTADMIVEDLNKMGIRVIKDYPENIPDNLTEEMVDNQWEQLNNRIIRTSSPTTSIATAPSRRTATRSCASSSAHARRSSRAASGSTESSSLSTTRYPRSLSSQAATTGRTPPPRPPRPAPPACPTTPSPRRCARSSASRTGSSSSASSTASAGSTTRRRRTPPPRAVGSRPTTRRSASSSAARSRARTSRPSSTTYRPASARSTSSEPRATSWPPPSTPPGASTSAPETSRQPSRSPLPRPSPATSSFCHRLQRATTSSRTSRSAATRSAAWSRSCRESEEVPVRVEPARARHGRARPLRARHGVQRDLGVRRARERQPARLRREAGDLRADGRRVARRRVAPAARTHPPARADPRRHRPHPLPRRARDRLACQRGAALDRRRPARLPAVRARQARDRRLDGRLPVAAATAAHAEGARAAARDPRARLRRPGARRAGPRHRAHAPPRGRRGPPRLGNADEPARGGVRDRDRARCDRRLVVAVPARPAADLPRSVEGPDRRRAPERAGADQLRLGRDLRPRHRVGARVALLPAGGAHGHDVRRRRRAARARRRHARPDGVLCLRLRRDPARDRLPRSVREAARGRGSRRSSAGRRRSTWPPPSASRRSPGSRSRSSRTAARASW